jgi:gliding motility-associated-like protein
MKSITRYRCIRLSMLLLVYVFTSLALRAQPTGTTHCPNADFSMGNFTNWTARTGNCCPINLPTMGVVNGRHTITTPGPDNPSPGANQIAALQRVPPGKTSAARLGNSAVGAQAEALSYTFNVTPQNALFMYDFAVVLQEASNTHPPNAMARFELQVRDQFGNIIPCTNYIVSATSGIPGFQNQGWIRWRNWTRVGVELLNQIGSNVTIEARTGDCAWYGHFGYGYIHAECSPLQINIDYCVGDTIAIMNAPNGFANYQWRLQGNSQVLSNSQAFTIVNPVPGQFTYEVTITSVMGCTAVLTALLNPVVPTPGFTTTNLCDGAIQFTDVSVVPNAFISNWQWDFGDGNTSTVQNPLHTYTQPGTYNVTLIPSTGSGCNDTITLPVVVPPILSPNFTVSQNCGLTKVFTDASTISAPGSLASWSWNFGNGQTSTSQNPTVTYNSPGTYNVQLTVTDNAGCTKTITQPVNVFSVPTANFAVQQTCMGNATAFTNQSSIVGGGALNFSWNFGNGQTSNAVNPVITYNQTGSYPVTLIVTGPGNGCSDTITQNANVVPTPVPSFTLPGPCGLSQQILNTSTVAAPATITQNNWNLGNGQVSNQQNPTTNYFGPGTYNVSLTVTANNGCSAATSQPYTVFAFPNANFTAPQTCSGTATQFTNTTTLQGPGILTHSWNFGNGATSNQANPLYTYPQHGTYTVTLISTGPGGCTDTVSHPLVIAPTPVASFTLPPSCGLSGIITNTSTVAAPGNLTQFNWNLGNGQISNQQNAPYNYNSPGLYNVTLTAITSDGCASSATQPFQVYSIPNAQFSAPQTCHPLPVVFTNSTTIQNSSVSTWQWSFGDGNTSNQASPQHVYGIHGIYNATLIAIGPGGCSDTATQTVNVPPTPVAQFTLPPACGLTNTFTNQSSILPPGQIVTHQWSFGDGNSSGATSPTNSYTNPGTYNVSLITVSDQGCRDTLVRSFTTYAIPVAAFTAPQTCFGLPLTVTDQTTIQNSNLIAWNWNMGDGTVLGQQNFNYNYASHGTYPITLIVTGEGGCTDTLTQQVVIPPKPVAGFVLPKNCGMPTPLQNTSTISAPGSIVTNLWSFGDGNTSNQTNPLHVYGSDGQYVIRLEVISDQGCRDTLESLYNKYHYPVASFTAPNTCHTSTTLFTDESTVINDAITQWQWSLGDGSNQNSATFSHTYANFGSFPIQLIVTSSHGCADTATGTVVIHPLPLTSFSTQPVCRGLPTMFMNNTTIASGQLGGFQWDFGGSGLSGSTQVNPSAVIVTPGTYTVTLTGTSEFGCTTSYTAPVTVWPRPDVSFSAGPLVGCQPLLVRFTNESGISSGNSISSYHWEFGNGANSQSVNPSYWYLDPGQFTVTLSAVSDKGCDSSVTYTNYITVHPKPVADFAYSPPFPTSVQSEIFIEDRSQGATEWNYLISDGSVYTIPTYFHTLPSDTGIYTMLQVVRNQFGCVDSAERFVRLAPDYTVYIPNAFSPNKDGLNDAFRVHGLGIVEARMWVFDRWGQELAYLENLEPLTIGWDGMYNREPLKQDVYVYKIIVRDIFGEEHEYFGKVNLIR